MPSLTHVCSEGQACSSQSCYLYTCVSLYSQTWIICFSRTASFHLHETLFCSKLMYVNLICILMITSPPGHHVPLFICLITVWISRISLKLTPIPYPGCHQVNFGFLYNILVSQSQLLTFFMKSSLNCIKTLISPLITCIFVLWKYFPIMEVGLFYKLLFLYIYFINWENIETYRLKE